MPVQVTHNNDGHFYTIDVDLAKEGAEVFDLTTYFKGRVGDSGFGLRVRWFWQGQLYNTVGKKPHVEGVVGQYSFKKANNDVGRELVMSPDADPVSFTGDVNDCQADGYATYYFPQQMFPQDGMFKGTIGLRDDSGKTARYTSVDIWFKVYPNAGGAQMGQACDYYISELDKAIKEAEEDLKAGEKAQQQIIDEFQQKVTSLINQINGQAADTQTTLANLKASIQALEDKIQQDGLFTQAEAEAFEQKILNEIKQQQDDLISQLNASSQEALYASQTDWIAPLPDYMASNWAGVVNAVPHGQHIFNFGLITDNHFQFDNLYSYRALDHYVWFGEATRRANVDAVLVDGDNINGDNYSLTYAEPNRKQLIKSTLTIVDVLEGSVDALTPVFWIKGNHDNGMMNEIGISGPKSTLSEEDLKHFYHTTDCRYGEVRDGDSLYFYKDYPEQKIRLIGLNSNDDTDELNPDGSWKTKDMNDHKFRQPQLEWLVSQALKVDDPDYQVMFFFHVPLDRVFKETGLQNTDAFIQIIKCFKAGTSTTINADGKYPITGLSVDFTKQGPRTVVGIFNGHLHLDASNTTALDGTPVIEQTSSTIHDFTGVRPKDTINEDAWSLFSIDTEKRQIHMYRFGNGNDQSFSY